MLKVRLPLVPLTPATRSGGCRPRDAELLDWSARETGALERPGHASTFEAFLACEQKTYVLWDSELPVAFGSRLIDTEGARLNTAAEVFR